MIYLDTSVLLVHTLTESIERNRAKDVRGLFSKIDSGLIAAATSFYALHEVFVFALENAPDVDTGSAFGKAALQKILADRLMILPFVTRTDRRRLAPRFSALKDSTDLPHAISAYVAGCEAIVAYDEHFRAISAIISYKSPGDCV
ncbi:MAG: PIN domain-containing protein [Deltaproteobacteria bacterium]|nr:PIN domain-containing protein [Deltaproteobacteria bacterium]